MLYFIVTVFLVMGLWIIKDPVEYVKSGTAMDTVVSIRVRGWGMREKVEGALERIAGVESRMSKTIASSDVSRINNGGSYWGGSETLRVINRGIYFGGESGGVFDISIGPLMDVYASSNPSKEDISEALALVDYSKLDPSKPIPKGMKVDLGGIAKGYAGDEAAFYLRQNGISDIIISLGGDVITSGSRTWKVGIQNPFAESGEIMGTLDIINKSVATSGAYERGAHIIDPRSGKVVDNGVASATVIASTGMDADAMATMLYILGSEGLPTVEKCGGKGIVIMNDGAVYMSQSVELTISNKAFKKVEL